MSLRSGKEFFVSHGNNVRSESSPATPVTRKLNRWLFIWASISTIIAGGLAILQFLFPPQLVIKDLDTLIVVLAEVTKQLNAGAFESASPADRQQLAEKISRLDSVVTRTFAERAANLDPFVLKKNDAIFLVDLNGTRKSFSIGDIYSHHSYLYVGFEGKREQLYVGKHIEFGSRSNPCTVTLLAIYEPRQEGSFDFRC